MNEPFEDIVDEPTEVANDAVVAKLVGGHREFLAFLERRVGDRAIAEDLLQEAFAKGLDKLAGLREHESVVAWFYRILRNAIIDHYRHHAVARAALDKLHREAEAHTTPNELVEQAVCQCVRQLAGTLKPEYAAALVRVDIDGASVRQFADEAGITANNASVRVHRAREALKRQVVKSCGTCAEHGCLDCTCGAPKQTSFKAQ